MNGPKVTTPVTTEARVEELFNQHVDAVFRFCRVQLNEALAQEVTSDVFVVAWQKLDQVPPDCALAWLLGVARRLMAFQLRGERRRRALITKISSEPRARRSEPDPADAIAGADLAQRAMASLSQSDQSLLWLAAPPGPQSRRTWSGPWDWRQSRWGTPVTGACPAD